MEVSHDCHLRALKHRCCVGLQVGEMLYAKAAIMADVEAVGPRAYMAYRQQRINEQQQQQEEEAPAQATVKVQAQYERKAHVHGEKQAHGQGERKTQKKRV